MTDDELIEAMARAWVAASDQPRALFKDQLASARIALAVAKREIVEHCAKTVENTMPATLDTASDQICEALEYAAARIRRLADE